MAQLSNDEIMEFNKLLGSFAGMNGLCKSLQAENKLLKERLDKEREENSKLREQYNTLIEKVIGKI